MDSILTQPSELTLDQALGQQHLLSFIGMQPSPEILETLRRQQVGGVTLFRSLNVQTPAQVHDLSAALQQAARASGQPPLLIAADQEGGQLMAIGGATPFPGNMALGAAGSAELAYRTGYAIGCELAAMGVNVNYAPVCDVNVNPDNPVVGTRSFGEDPALVARLGAALIEGLQAAGVAAVAKHFPGHGDTTTDSHHGTPILPHDEARLRRVELPPFVAAVQSGVKMMMTAHVALPALNDGSKIPATLSHPILHGLLRRELGFQGVIVSDALEMKAIRQGSGLAIDAIAAVAAGIDLLLLNSDIDAQQSVYAGLLQAAQRGLLSVQDITASAHRILALKSWLSRQPQPSLDVVNCAEHRSLALESARRAITLVRDDARRLPLRLSSDAKLAAILPRPADLTPADTSSYVTPSLARAFRRYHPAVEEFILPLNPSESDVSAIYQRVRDYDFAIVGTINATMHPGQATLVKALLDCDIPLIAVALRLPYDLQAYPAAPTYVCAYSILDPSLEALAEVLWGEQPCQGHLPVSIPGLYPIGHGL
jgi:beta-N-acetylhexosaminidase